MGDDVPAEISELSRHRARRVAEPPRLLSFAQVAELLCVSHRTVRRLVHDHDLPVVEIAGVTRVRSDHLAAWIEQHTHYGGATS